MVEAALNFHDTTVVSNTRPLKVNGQCESLAIPKSGEHFRGHAGLGIATRPPWGGISPDLARSPPPVSPVDNSVARSQLYSQGNMFELLA